VGAISGKAIAIPQLAGPLAGFVNRFVVDKTGLAGRFDAELTWTPDGAATVSGDPIGPSIFTAIQQQLGLKLVAERGPVNVLVVDGASELVPN
jgi:uncharacterized protein (TIGR03435 family)